MPPHTAESPAKKQSKWSAEEDALIIELRGSGMKWDDISKRLPGRSAISCRLHYQNYLERRSEWDEERKNKLARLYERFKPEMWAKVAEEMQVPWRAAEAIHWQIGETEMARRAGVVPFALSSTEPSHPHSHRSSPARGHVHSQSQGSLPRDLSFSGIPSPRYAHGPNHPSISIPPPLSSSGRVLGSRRESIPPPRGPYDHPPHPYSPALGHPGDFVPYGPGPGLAPIQTAGGPGRATGPLPSVAELTTGVSPYSTPAFSGPVGIPPGASPIHSGTTSPRSILPPYPPFETQMGGGPGPVAKRRASPEMAGALRETSRRRHLDPTPEEAGSGSGSGDGPGPGPGPGEYGGGPPGLTMRRPQ